MKGTLNAFLFVFSNLNFVHLSNWNYGDYEIGDLREYIWLYWKY
jgi:hypothetical protein